MRCRFVLWGPVLVLSVATTVSARQAGTPSDYSAYRPRVSAAGTASLDRGTPLHATAVQATTWLASFTFDSGVSCVGEGWTSVDISSRPSGYWHVDDFAGMGPNYHGHVGVLDGSHSLWCGARASTAAPFCSYAVLPGYGNNWNQAFGTIECVDTGPGAVLQFDADWDSEPAYDATVLQVTGCTGMTSDDSWVTIAGGIHYWDGNLDDFSLNGDTTITIAIPDSLHGGGADPLKVRFSFWSDGAWSDEDALWDTDGAFVIDNLSLTSLSTETFEGESVGDTQMLSGNWGDVALQGYGDFAALYVGALAVQDDPCRSNITCMWAFLNGSTATYACGGYPGQTAVPYENSRGQYINNEVWSPQIPISGTGSQFELAFDVYRDLALDPLVFYVWHVRSIDALGCPGRWEDRNFVYYGATEWHRDLHQVGDLIDAAAPSLQVALGVIDMCPFWCGSVGTGTCHSHAPMFDNVDVYRIASDGPQWSVRDIDLFQDTFPGDGTTTGTARIDAAIDILPAASPNIHPGDSTTVRVADPDYGLAADPYTGFGAAVYVYVSVSGPTADGLSGEDLTDDSFRWPYIDSTVDGSGIPWFRLRADTSFSDGGSRSGAQPDAFCIDLNDNLFVPGDEVSFVFAAQNDNAPGTFTYWTPSTGPTTDFTAALAGPAECTILPASDAPSPHFLYVDGMNARGAQPYFDEAFAYMGISWRLDRYDIRGPSSNVGNHPGTRCVDPLQQLLPFYRFIIWNTGNLQSGLIGDGTIYNEKSNDALMLLTFLDNLETLGGVYLSGDNIAEEWPLLTGSAIPLRDTYIQHTLVDGDHVDRGFAVSPLVIGEDNGAFDHILGPDTLVAYGGCPTINDFDVLAPAGSSTQAAKYDNGIPGQNGAIIAQHTQNPTGNTVGVVLSGFSFHEIREDHPSNTPERAHHMADVLAWLGYVPVQPAATPGFANSLGQNYPNPFNPTTTIDFTVKELAFVSVKIYNVRGQRVRTLVNDRFSPGLTHRVAWDGRNDAGQQVSSGVYFYKLVTKGFSQTKKMVLLK